MSSQEPGTENNSDVDKSESSLSEKYATEFMKGLSMQRDNPEFCDVTVVIEDHEFQCHRIILASSSGFFNALLSSGMREDLERKVDLKGISIETFTHILDCIYKAKNIITEKNVFDVWHAANQLQILPLLKDCEAYVKENISAENCFAIYQTSKLLDSEVMKKFSWGYILREFDAVRGYEEILMLTADEMKQMVTSHDLVTISEDRVVETVLKWTATNPEANSLDLHSEAKTEDAANVDNHQTVAEESDTSRDNQPSENKSEKLIHRRAEYLPELLEASRICLLSGQCLMETLWMNPMVQANEKAIHLVQEAIRYQLQHDQRQNRCPASAVYRGSSKFRNVLLAIQHGTGSSFLIGKEQNGGWGYTANRSSSFTAYSAVCYDNNVYIGLHDGNVLVYMSTLGQWKDLPKPTTSAIVAMEALSNFLYAIYKENDHYIINMINIKDTVCSLFQEKWCKAGTLSTGISISCTTVVGDKIMFFGSQTGKEDTVVECFDTSVRSSSRLDDMPKPSVGMVSFRKDNEAFVIQKSGTLWRIKSCPSPPFIEVKYETLLWDFYRDLKGATLFKDELLLFGPSISSSQTDEQWELAVKDVFSRVKNVACNENYGSFMHVVLPKVTKIEPY